MHTLQTTMAYVLDAYPNGESNFVYKLFTRDLGLLYAHAQSVREMKSKNKYALQVGYPAEVTLVRGREVWRVTSAQHVPRHTTTTQATHMSRKILHLIATYSAVEDVAPDVFDITQYGTEAATVCQTEDVILVEAITVLRIMDKLGFVARPLEELVIASFLESHTYSEVDIEHARTHKQKLIARVNIALEEAE